MYKNNEGKFITIGGTSSVNLDKLELEMLQYAKRKYSEMKSRVKRKNFNEIQFTINEFLQWIMNNDNYKKIYSNYLDNNKDRNLCPSVDRLDDYKTYSIDNIRLVTWRENNDKYNSDRLIGKNTKQSKPVMSICIYTGKKNEYHSAHYASQQTKTDRSSINRSCRTNSKNPINKSRSGSFIWIFQDDYNKLFS